MAYPFINVPNPLNIEQPESRPTNDLSPVVDSPMDYQKLRAKISRLADDWKGEKDRTIERRDLRYLEVDCEEKQKTGEFKPDEIYVCLHVIDDNIRKEAPAFIQYLVTSKKIAIFKPKVNPQSLNMELLENFFTKLFRYPGWEIPFFKVLDGSQQHGWDAVEVVGDVSKPGKFSVEHIVHENLWFPNDTEDIQKSPLVVRNCKVCEDELRNFKDVNTEEVNKIFENRANVRDAQESLENVQKVFFKYNGLIYVCWVQYEYCNDFLRAPKPLSLGRQVIIADPNTGQTVQSSPYYEKSYPIVILPYIVSENNRIKDLKGRCFFDQYIQESASSMLSHIINGWHRASQVNAAPSDPTSSGAPEQLDKPVIAGKIWNKPMNFFSMPYPNESGMSIVQQILTLNKAETSQVNFASFNREDSRKTAAEIKAASFKENALTSVQVVLFSMFIKTVVTKCWSISQSMLQQNLIPLDDLNAAFLDLEYELYSAGDVEVLKRAETLDNLKSVWPVVAGIPSVAMIILEDILRLTFPSQADKYVEALRQGDPRLLIASLATILNGIIANNPEIIPPESKDQLINILQQAQMMTQSLQAPAFKGGAPQMMTQPQIEGMKAQPVRNELPV